MNLTTLITQLTELQKDYGNREVVFNADRLPVLTGIKNVYVMYPPPWDGSLNSVVLDDTFATWEEQLASHRGQKSNSVTTNEKE